MDCKALWNGSRYLCAVMHQGEVCGTLVPTLRNHDLSVQHPHSLSDNIKAEQYSGSQSSCESVAWLPNGETGACEKWHSRLLPDIIGILVVTIVTFNQSASESYFYLVYIAEIMGTSHVWP